MVVLKSRSSSGSVGSTAFFHCTNFFQFSEILDGQVRRAGRKFSLDAGGLELAASVQGNHPQKEERLYQAFPVKTRNFVRWGHTRALDETLCIEMAR
jgi:hypothetical protein